MRLPLRYACAPAALLLLLACSDDATRPQGLEGRYLLQRAAGQALPATVFADTIRDPDGDFHLRVVALEGRLELGAGGRYDHRVTQEVHLDGQRQPGGRWADLGTYTVAGDTLRFESSFIQGVRFAAVREGGRLRIEQDLAGEGLTVLYLYAR